MKKQILSIMTVLLTTIPVSAQSYTFGLIRDFNNMGNPHEYTFVITPDFTDATPSFTGIQFTVAISTGNTLTNYTNILTNEFNPPNINVTGTLLAESPFFLGDGTLDLWVFTMTPPSSLVTAAHTAGVAIPILSFEVANNPTAGTIAILENNDPISVGLLGFGSNVNNIGGVDIGGAGEADIYAGTNPAANSYNLMDPLLNVDEVTESLTETIVFPNPAVTSFKIQGNIKDIDGVSIYDINGGFVKEIDTDIISEFIPIKDLSNGIYFIQLTSKNIVKTLKFIKQ
ncbi:T9SS type A sorting domain-containing protein [Aquimarina sp. 2201CG14-23]|uniref:T9SS type A sorting domain-containing protein n=1 Tax=Aquimarina mycalae TaxID=3040073 RepID=UPI002477EDBD|nr:T9SS type A sorting domain-containing protein [Aquimarina sp. 2201CG14-23]MDH7448121.1 T9SS type A sorting domain-containing protein [Aquimarina sp. 2201CG14-23]